MHYHIHRADTHSLATITQKTSEVVTAFITVDIHQHRTVEQQAAELMYPDALLSGTATHTRAEFLSAVNLLGASINLSLQNSELTISLKSTKEQFGKLLKLVEAMLSTPAFQKSELARIKSTTCNELHEAKEDSKAIAFSELINTLYGPEDRKYTYGIEESIVAVKTISAKELKKVHAVVNSQPWTCSIAGEKTSIVQFEKTIERLKEGTQVVPLNGIHQQKPPKQSVLLKHIPSRTNIDFSIGAPLPITLHHPDYIPLSFGLAVLGKVGGFTGRLMSTVREKEGLTYGIYSRLEGFSGTEQGYWRVITFFAPEKTVQALTSTFREITALYKKGITEGELEKFKTIINTQQTLLNDSVGSMLSDLHVYHCHQFTLEEMKEHKARVSTLTVAEVNKAIKTYLQPENLTVSGAGPTKAVAKDILAWSKSI